MFMLHRNQMDVSGCLSAILCEVQEVNTVPTS